MNNYNPQDWIYDLECYPNIFTCDLYHMATGTRLLFEISDRINQVSELYQFLMAMKATNCRMIGFNNIGYDYPMLHFLIEHISQGITHELMYEMNMKIINTPWNRSFDNVVWDNETHITQIDLYKIRHFDNEARRTSLKLLEFNMQMDSIQDLPYPPGTTLNDDQKNMLISYNDHDVDATRDFYIHTLPMIEFREELSKKYDRNFLNHNDTKIGKDYFIMRLEESLPGSCYSHETGSKKPRQTIRSSIKLSEVIFDYIQFEQPEFQRVRDWLASQTITETKGVFNDVSATINGFKYDFGAGGIHGSIDSCSVESDDNFVLIDWDVASYYPNIAIANQLFPEHLSEEFCTIYKDVFEQRKSYAKGTPENAMLKLALNGVYGDSNNKYSPFYDPKYTMSITINGQLLLCKLAEILIDIPGLQMMSINTDGITVRCPREYESHMNDVCKWWENWSCLELESAVYSRMFIRDVNNYIGEYTDGRLKRKGVYEYNREWHQNQSAMVIPKAAEAALVHGVDITQFIHNHADVHDFMLRTKVGRADNLVLNDTEELQRVTRYYISTTGGSLTKISPPTKGYIVGQWKRANGLTDMFYDSVLGELDKRDEFIPSNDLDSTCRPWDERINTKNRSKYTERRTAINSGYLVTPCNDINDADRTNINFNYYIDEVKKLVEVMK